MKSGKIKHWNDKKGYGFIQPDEGGKDLFFHISTWQEDNIRPAKGQQVDFTENTEDKRDNVLWVKLKNSAPKSQTIKKFPRKSTGWLKKVTAAVIIAAGSLGTLTVWNKAPIETKLTAKVSSSVSLEEQQIAKTLALIKKGGPFPYAKDGTVFQNREKRLPVKYRGFYHEYTVPTPYASDRGARRIVTGGNPPEVYYYTADHYRSFRQLEVK